MEAMDPMGRPAACTRCGEVMTLYYDLKRVHGANTAADRQCARLVLDITGQRAAWARMYCEKCDGPLVRQLEAEEGGGGPGASSPSPVGALVLLIAAAGGYAGHRLGGGWKIFFGSVAGAWLGTCLFGVFATRAFVAFAYDGHATIGRIRKSSFASLVLLLVLFVVFTPAGWRGNSLGYANPAIPAALFLLTLAAMIRAFRD